MTIFTIGCIVFLMAVALWFINDSRVAHRKLEYSTAQINGWEACFWEAMKELAKWKRPRGKNGRFTK